MKKISIITPTNNSQKTISQTIESVIKQSYQLFEHIIVDNCSTDNTIVMAEKLYANYNKEEKLKIISEPDAGIADAFNKGIKTSDGEIVGILNADDYYYDNSVLQKVANSFMDNTIWFSHGNIFFEDEVYGSNIRPPLLCPITKALPFNHPTMFFMRKIYENYGFYDQLYKYAMDFEFICRLEKKVPNYREKGKYIDGEPLVYMRAGGASWENEINSLVEVKRALIKYDFWD